MPVLMVNYDLVGQRRGPAHEQVLSVIKSEKNWARITGTSYVMETNLSPRTVYTRIKPHLDPEDCLLVFELAPSYFGQHQKSVVDWLKPKLTPPPPILPRL